MSDSASSGKHERSSSAPRARGGSTVDIGRRAADVPPVKDNQPTVISNAPPVAPEAPAESRPPVIPRLLPGNRVGQFELLECVGGGGMGRVYRAMDTGLGRIVALKVLSPEQAADSETLLRFRNEARSAARLNHDNIVQVYHVGEDQDLPYIVFEFIEGVHIRSLVQQRGPLSLAEAISYTFQVAEALAHAASRSIVHRDIKPSNVLVTPEGQAKLIDMGLARLQRLEEQGDDLTASGVTLGTFDYISPEQARDPRNADVRSDIYSLGCTFFYMLTGRPPFPVGTVLQKLLQHQGDEPPDVRQFRPELAEEVSRLVRKMMAKDPRNRYQNPDKLMQALALLAEGVGLRPLGPGQTVWVAPKETKPSLVERHLPWAVPVAALLLIVLLLHFFWSAAARQATLWSNAWMSPIDEPTHFRDPSGPISGIGPEDGMPKEVARPADGAQPSPGTATSAHREKPDVPPARPETAALAAETYPPGKAPAAPGSESRLSAASASSVPARSDGPPGPVEVDGAGPTATGQGVAKTPSLVKGDADRAKTAEADLARSEAVAPLRADPTISAPPSEMGANRVGVFVVDGVGEKENRFATLGAAASAAINGSVIELCYSGRREERPIALGNLKLTIRAGEGFQPIVVFRPAEVDPLQYPRSMITLNGSRLTLLDLALEMDIPRGITADRWSLVELGQAETVHLERCSLTIRNASDQQTAYHPEVVFLFAKEMPQVAAVADDLAATPRPVEVSLVHCIVRGEAVFLRVQGLRPIDLSWDNGLLSTTERLLVSDSPESPSLSAPGSRITLKHLTAAVRGGLGQVTAQSSAVQINCADSIVMGTPGSPLLEQIGLATTDQFRQRISWTGDRNFYVGFTNYWSIKSPSAEASAESMTLDAWRSHWGAAENNAATAVQWKQLAPADRPTSAHAPADYALSDAPGENPPRKAASDGRDAGMNAERLPPLPQDPALPAKTGQEPSTSP